MYNLAIALAGIIFSVQEGRLIHKISSNMSVSLAGDRVGSPL